MPLAGQQVTFLTPANTPQPKSPLEIQTEAAAEQALKDKRQAQIDAAADDAAIQAAIKAHTGADGVPDFQGAIGDLYKTRPNAGVKVQGLVTKMREDAAKSAKAELDAHTLEATMISKLFNGVQDASQYASARKMVLASDPDAARLIPEAYDPTITSQLGRIGVDVGEQNKKEQEGLTNYASGNWQKGLALRTSGVTNQDDYANALHEAVLHGAPISLLTTLKDFTPENLAKIQAMTLLPKDVAEIEDKATGRELQRSQQAQTQKNEDAMRSLAERQLALSTRRENREEQAAGAAQAGGAPKGTLNEEALNQAADRYFETGVLPPLGMGGAAANNRTAIMNRAGERHADGNLSVNSAAYKANASTLTALTKQLNAVEAFENTGLKNLKMFTDAAAKIPDTGIPWLNTPIRALSSGLVGSENMAAVNAARQVALTEISRVVSNPNLTGALSDSAREEVLGLIPANATFKQIKRVASVLEQDMANRRGALSDQKADIERRLGGVSQEKADSGKSVTIAELSALASRRGTSLAIEKQRAIDAGYVIK